MNTQHEARRLTAITYLIDKLTKEANRTKRLLAEDAGGAGGRVIARYDGEIIGDLISPKDSHGAPVVVDEDQAVAWLVDQYGEAAFTSLIDTRPRLTEQGKKDVQAAALRGEVPGVEIPEPKPSAPRFTLMAEADDLVPAMFQSGVLSVDELLRIEGA